VPFAWSDDVDQATWWTGNLHPFANDVGSVIPEVFEAYARVFHPVVDAGERRTWAEVAESNGRIAHAEMQLHEIARPLGTPRPLQYNPNDWMDRARVGSLPREGLVVLSEVLARHTATPDRCWCCVWEGYGQLRGGAAARTLAPASGRPRSTLAPQEVLDGPRVEVPARAYYLLFGRLADMPDLYDLLGQQSPNVWWPDDRAWCVATEIDFAWTYVGGGKAAIDAVLADRRLEALPAKVTDRFTVDSDVVNAALDAQR
jgi:hypothetical protein